MPRPVRWALTGAAIAFGLGAVVGLIIGLFVYPPTALFAAVELALPGALVGAFLGVAAGGLAAVIDRAARKCRATG